MASNMYRQKIMNSLIIPHGFKLVRVGWLVKSKMGYRYHSPKKGLISNDAIIKEEPMYILEKI